MRKLFSQYKKIIIPCLGVVLFMITGALAIFATSSKPQQVISETKTVQAQTQTQQAPQVHEVNEKPQPLPEISESRQNQPYQEKHEDWFVYVTGAVHKPGVYKLPDNPRVFHAIEAAGGMTLKADQNSLNLAEKILTDGLHIHIEEKGEREAREAKEAKRQASREAARMNMIQTQNQTQPLNVRVPGVQASSMKTQHQNNNNNNNAGSNMVDVNHASEQELTKLRGVGPAIAKRIIDFRNNMGAFKSPEDLLQVRGIGPKTLEKMRPQILIR